MQEKLTAIDHLKSCATASKNFTNELVSDLAMAVTGAIEEIDEVKVDKDSLPSPSDGIPKAAGTASSGTSNAYAREDHVHPEQESVSGNAGTATKLQTLRSINGVKFDGSKDLSYSGVCSTPASTAAKTVLLSNQTFDLKDGSTVAVEFTYSNSSSVPTLNVNSTGAKSIMKSGTTSTRYTDLIPNKKYLFIYDGTYWRVINENIDLSGIPSPSTSDGTSPAIISKGVDSTPSPSSYPLLKFAGNDAQYARQDHFHPFQSLSMFQSRDNITTPGIYELSGATDSGMGNTNDGALMCLSRGYEMVDTPAQVYYGANSTPGNAQYLMKYRQSPASAWHDVKFVDDSDWITPTSGASGYGTSYLANKRFRYRKIDDQVFIDIFFLTSNSYTLTNNSILFSLPSAYRPTVSYYDFSAVVSSGEVITSSSNASYSSVKETVIRVYQNGDIRIGNNIPSANSVKLCCSFFVG